MTVATLTHLRVLLRGDAMMAMVEMELSWSRSRSRRWRAGPVAGRLREQMAPATAWCESL
jgi:hypothetical protein